jgi:cobaltochelatase CobS
MNRLNYPNEVKNLTQKQLILFCRKADIRVANYAQIDVAEFGRQVQERVDYAPERYRAAFAEAFPRGAYRKRSRSSASAYAPTLESSAYAPPTPTAPLVEAYSDATAIAKPDTAKQLAELLADLAKNGAVDETKVREIVQAELRGMDRPRPVTVTLKDSATNAAPVDLGLQHYQFPDILAYMQARDHEGHPLNIWLTGAAGTGKTRGVKEAAKALGRKFYFNGATDTKFELNGFVTATGQIVSKPFKDAFIAGGIYLADEIDSWLPAATIALNAALSGRMADFPDGCVEAHEDFQIIAAANTYGNGATADYCGRNRQDASTLDRFIFMDWKIDEALERALTKNDAWVSRVQNVRAHAKAKGIKHLITPRACFFGDALLRQGVAQMEVEKLTLRKGLSNEQWAGIS